MENEVNAFCVNLSSNKNIRVLDVGVKHLMFSSRTGCTVLSNAFATNPAMTIMLNFERVGAGVERALMTLERLDLSEKPAGNEGVSLVAEILGNIKFPLRTVELIQADVGKKE